ncbi:MAG: hypothetical protein LBO09_06480 [Candidatus Peribacteria bacterium]|jgi:hypothetical protein|nr:hypothetical protein [Candidatus Peribacteria bacterium]
MAGRRLYDSAIVDLYNNNGRYWSSSLSSTSPTNASNFSLRPSSINPNTSNVRSLGYSVRCFKNDIRNEICNRITDIPKAECKALVDFYYSTNGDGWTNGSGGASTRPWLTGSTACNRYGLTCAGTAPNKYVSKIVLGNNNLSGVLNPSLSVLNGLGSLDIYTNQIKGTLPSEYTEWTKLTAFDVSHNQLT